MADLTHPPAQRFHHVEEDEIVNIFGIVAQSLCRSIAVPSSSVRVFIRALHPQEGLKVDQVARMQIAQALSNEPREAQ
jgi:hypothetical protein